MDFRDVCTGAVAAKGGFRAPWVRDAFETVDRAHFVPRRVWAQVAGPDGLYPVIDRDQDPDGWYRAVWDPHHSVVTQMDDHRLPDNATRGDFTSSVSAPDIVCTKLSQLDLAPGHRVLELGTGSGYATALLCERVGDGNVTTVEIDRELSVWGAENLAKAGYHPEVVCGDGLAGRSASAPFDRVIATAAVRHIPRAWVEQCADGAVILAPFGTCYANGALLKLTVDGGTASGRFVGTAHYMWVRSERPSRELYPPDASRKSASVIEPGQVLSGSWAQDFTLGLWVPDIGFAHRGEGEERQVQFWDQPGTSVTLVSYAGWYEPTSVVAYGPRNLWAEVVAAYTTWRTAGQPDLARFGVTVSGDGQRTWLDDPGNVIAARHW